MQEKANVVAAGWGTILECRTDHLAAIIIRRTVFERTSILGGCVNRMIIQFFKASIPPSSLYSIHPFHQIMQNSSAVRIWEQH